MGKEIEGAVLLPEERLQTTLAVRGDGVPGFVVHILFQIGTWKATVQGVGGTPEEAIQAAERVIAAERKLRGV